MGHSYSRVVNDREQLQYEKTHDNGDETMVVANIGANGDWNVKAVDFLARSGRGPSRQLGTFPTKSAARQKMTSWMSANPKGVQPGGHGATETFAAMEDATDSLFTGGGMF